MCKKDRIVEIKGKVNGLEYAVVFQLLGYRCGYVSIPNSLNLEFDFENGIDCHGGITYNDNYEFLFPGVDRVIGFDCMHLCDGVDLDTIEKYWGKHIAGCKKNSIHFTGKIWSAGEVEKECKSIINQINNIIKDSKISKCIICKSGIKLNSVLIDHTEDGCEWLCWKCRDSIYRYERFMRGC